jgi:dihydroneopterin aldolase
VKNFDVLKSKEELIYDLIFTEKVDFNINISDYVDDIYNYEDFVSEIKKILKKSKVKIISSVVKLDSKTATWELKVKK